MVFGAGLWEIMCNGSMNKMIVNEVISWYYLYGACNIPWTQMKQNAKIDYKFFEQFKQRHLMNWELTVYVARSYLDSSDWQNMLHLFFFKLLQQKKRIWISLIFFTNKNAFIVYRSNNGTLLIEYDF